MPLFILFLAFPLIETWLLVKFSGAYGFGNTILLVLITAFAGSALAKQQGLEVFNKLQLEVSQGKTPSKTLIEGLLILISGVILLLPGLISDAIGITLLIPPVRKLIASYLPKYIPKKMGSGPFQFKSSFQFGNSQFQQKRSKNLKETEEAEYQVLEDDDKR